MYYSFNGYIDFITTIDNGKYGKNHGKSHG